MATSISMTLIWTAGKNLGRFGGTQLPDEISVEMYGEKMVIKQKTKQVFSMKKVAIVDTDLLIDYPKTAEGQDGRGWGMLAMLIALYYGQSKGCTQVQLGSQIEQTTKSMSFWTKFGIARMGGTPLLTALERGIGWVLKNCRQEDKVLTEFVLR